MAVELVSTVNDDTEKRKLLNKQELDEVDRFFSLNSIRVLESRYLLRDKSGKVIESPKQLFYRVATLVTLGDIIYDPLVFDLTRHQPQHVEVKVSIPEPLKIGKFELNQYHEDALFRAWRYLNSENKMKVSHEELVQLFFSHDFDNYEQNIQTYYSLMASKDFMPNTPTLMNAGARLGQLSACFVLDIDDNLESIMETASNTAFIFKSGGGVGINYSKLRAQNSIVGSTFGVASGPLSFMGLIDKVTDVIKQGGKRRGANMGILDADHPDVEKFITAKRVPGVLENFNVSIGLKGPPGADPHIDLIAKSAWESAEPGLIFFDRVNEFNPLGKARGVPLSATNPCGEQSLYPFESCNLGSINLANFVLKNEKGLRYFDWDRYIKVIRICVQFLDNINDLNNFPLPKLDVAAKETRRIGLGIMGLSSMLIKLHSKYDGEGIDYMEKLAETLTYEAMKKSVELSKERGPFGLFEESGYKDGLIPVQGAYQPITQYDWKELIEEIKKHGIRNSYCTTVAPTGSIAMIADTSNGVEPTFALAYKKTVKVGDYYYKNEFLEEYLTENEIDIPDLWKRIAESHGSVQSIQELPHRGKEIFRTTFDISWHDQIKALAAWQFWINNAISKTINMPENATVEDVKKAYLMAYDSGLKGITVFRDGSRKEQVLHA